jgi:molecular chaperone DnaK (HSP70)
MAVPVGIDLGTADSVVAATEAGEPAVTPNVEGSRTTSSEVASPRRVSAWSASWPGGRRS